MTQNLNPSEQKIIELIISNPSVSIPEMAAIIGVGSRAIEKNIHKLKLKNLLHREGPNKGGVWIVAKKP